MSVEQTLRSVIDRALQLGGRAAALEADSALLGALPELDSMAVATLLTEIEEEFAIVIEDDEITAETFATFGSLCEFIERKLP